MTRGLLSAISMSAAVAAGFASLGALAASGGGMSAAQIVERNVAARGGLQAWRAVNTLSLSGQIDVGGTKPVKLPFIMTMKRPHKSRFEVNFDNQIAYQAYDGTQGWKVRPFLGRNEAEPYTPVEAKSAAQTADLDGPLIDYAAKGSQVELQGTDTIEGHRAYRLLLTTKDHVQRQVWIDASSFLELKVEGDPRKLDGRMHDVAVYYRDYRREDGLMIPHVLETTVAGVKQTHQMTIQHVTVNQPADDALFAKPQLPAQPQTQPHAPAARVAAK
ncbi:outer membrane lipoprotein-sorting protein [Paraburkholderia sp. MMS20-SJTN17]|uniref:Outer membrane lipoprotein-sorting protein n=1 Tax=Paraburkholderia translucens TaxID=2886945 RepID=A0ABS8K7N2_9BURK|nr:outer membrane lipoprotein-sorting protein [Paraburkholderia sp. MMS20-SJTN17]MCC8400756.1 outer membrane lipoprotein-sorting protein [Paraburkholderia sp. MMS20-SJTN17]